MFPKPEECSKCNKKQATILYMDYNTDNNENKDKKEVNTICITIYITTRIKDLRPLFIIGYLI